MCVHLAPRWRRRLFVLALAVAHVLLTVDARTLRKLNVGHKTEDTDSELPVVDKTTDPELTLVGDTNVGIVTMNLTQNLTAVPDKAWNSGSNTGDSQPSTDKSVSFNNLVNLTTTPSTSLQHLKHLEVLASKGLVSTNFEGRTRCVTRGKTNTSDLKQGDDDNDEINGSLDKEPNNAGADIGSDIKLINDTSTIQMITTNKAAIPEPVSFTILHSAPITQVPRSPQLVVGSFDHRTQGHPSSSLSAPSLDKEANLTGSAEVLENETKLAFSTTASRSLDQTLVVVIIGVVGSIGTVLMFVSRRLLNEQDDDLDLENSRIF